MVAARVWGDTPLIWWPDWAAWREGVSHPERVEFREPAPASSFCMTCAGNRLVWTDIGHGEGWVGHRCPTCDGKGWA